jgi:N-acetylglutamate synthase-like GNAT family acetyltransferase
MARKPTNNPIRLATPADLLFIEDLQRKFSNEVGFIPREATRNYLEMRCVKVIEENGLPAGLVLGREALRWNIAMRPIFQAAVDFTAQRRHLGLELVAAHARAARAAGQVALQACCREGIDANAFWHAAGFEEICRLDPSNARRRQVIVWRQQLWPDFEPAWYRMPPPVAGYRARKARSA